MSWKEEIEKMNEKWNGKAVACPKYYGDQIFTAIGVDYNGCVKINRRTAYSHYTAVNAADLQVLDQETEGSRYTGVLPEIPSEELVRELQRRINSGRDRYVGMNVWQAGLVDSTSERAKSDKWITTNDLTTLFDKLQGEWTARKERAVQQGDAKGIQHAKEQADAFEYLQHFLTSRAAERGAAQEEWSHAAADAFLSTQAYACQDPSEARAWRQAAWALNGHNRIWPKTPAVLRAYLIDADTQKAQQLDIGYCDDDPAETNAAYRTLAKEHVRNAWKDSHSSALFNIGKREFMAESAGGDVPTVRTADGKIVLYGTSIILPMSPDQEDMRALEEHTKRISFDESAQPVLMLDGVD